MKKIVYIVFVIVLLVIINNLIHSIFETWHKQDLLTNAQKQLEIEKNKNKKLKAELSYVKSPQFLEEQARDKLFMSKPGELDVLIPTKMISPQKPAKKIDNRQNWQKWIELFIR